MPVAPTYPGVYIEELSSGVRTITGVSTSFQNGGSEAWVVRVALNAVLAAVTLLRGTAAGSVPDTPHPATGAQREES
jgi:phage tail sheath protein FI